MTKTSRLREAARRATPLGLDKEAQVLQRMGDWFQQAQQNPEVRKALIRALIGAALGGGAAGGMALATPHDPEEGRQRVLGPALLGALLGGGAAAALPVGLKMLRGDIRLPGEARPGVTGRVGDTIARGVLSHPGMAIGGGVGALTRLRYGDVIGKAKELAYPTDATALVGPRKYPGLQSLLAGIGGAGRRAAQTIRHPVRAFTRPASRMREAAKLVGSDPKKYRALAAKGKLGLAAIPVGLVGGWLLDKYLRGEA